MWDKEFYCKFEESMWYKLLCHYMAKTELYDRSLSDLRSPYDPTEAYIVSSIQRRLSSKYASSTYRFICDMAKVYHIGFDEIYDVRKRCAGYSAQRWIDEYKYLHESGKLDFIYEYLEGTKQ